jgi:hypothetical protein
MSEEPNEADRSAAAAYTLASGDYVNEDLLAEHFAAHRQAAARAERERCVAALKNFATQVTDSNVSSKATAFTVIACCIDSLSKYPSID